MWPSRKGIPWSWGSSWSAWPRDRRGDPGGMGHEAPGQGDRRDGGRLGEEGAHVCVNGFGHMAEAEAVAAQIRQMGRRAIAVKADVSRMADIEAMVAAAIRGVGRVDVLG